MGQIINSLMDVVYLQKRIEYLENAISVLLEEHHLKGIYLFHQIKRKEVDKNYELHQLRNKIKYVLRKRKGEAEKDRKRDESQIKIKERFSAAESNLTKEFDIKNYSDSDYDD